MESLEASPSSSRTDQHKHDGRAGVPGRGGARADLHHVLGGLLRGRRGPRRLQKDRLSGRSDDIGDFDISVGNFDTLVAK